MGNWKHRVLVVTFLCALATMVAGAGQVLVFTTIDVPGAVLTNVQGINAVGELVGFYTDTAGKQHGFLRSGNLYRSIDFPNAGVTQVRGIGPAGDIVGSYQLPTESGGIPSHGFLMTRRGGFFKIDYPGHQNTIAQRILADGTVLGCYHDADQMETMHGMRLSHRGFDGLPESMTMSNGATPDQRLIVGLYMDMTDGRNKGFMLDRGKFSILEVPGSIGTNAWDVSPSGAVVGNFTDSAGVFHGFHYDGQTFGRVDVAGARATRVFGINAHGDMVGVFTDAAARTHGFLAQWVAQ